MNKEREKEKIQRKAKKSQQNLSNRPEKGEGRKKKKGTTGNGKTNLSAHSERNSA